MASKNSESPIHKFLNDVADRFRGMDTLVPKKRGAPTLAEFAAAQGVYDALMRVASTIKKVADGLKADILIPYTRQHGTKTDERTKDGFGSLLIALVTENGWKANFKLDVKPAFTKDQSKLVEWLRAHGHDDAVVENVDCAAYAKIRSKVPKKLREAVEAKPKESTRWERKLIKDKVCPKCRAKFGQNDAFCPKCGTGSKKATATKRPATKKYKAPKPQKPEQQELGLTG